MRQKKREMSEEFALGVLERAPYVTVSMTLPSGEPYCLPLSLARMSGAFYFHCALSGLKLEALRQNPAVCLSAVARCHPTMSSRGEFTLEYESAIAQGRAELVTDPREKVQALRAICQRFLPEHLDKFPAAIERSLHLTQVVRIRLTAPATGKRKLYAPDGRETPSDLAPKPDILTRK